MSEQFTDMKVNPRDVKFIRAYMQTGNASKAAVASGYKGKNAAVRGHQILKRLNRSFQPMMAESGMTILEILRRILLGLDAEDEHVIFDKDGNAHRYKTPNWPARARFVDIAIRLGHGYAKPQMDLPFEIQDGKVMITAEFATHTQHGMEAGS